MLIVDVPAWERVTNGASARPNLGHHPGHGYLAKRRRAGVLDGGADDWTPATSSRSTVRGTDLTVEVMDRVPDLNGAAGGSAVILAGSRSRGSRRVGLQRPDGSYVGRAGEVSTGELADAPDVRSNQVNLRSEALELADTIRTRRDRRRVPVRPRGGGASPRPRPCSACSPRGRGRTPCDTRTLGLTSSRPERCAIEVAHLVAAAAVGVGIGLGIGVFAGRALDLSGLTDLSSPAMTSSSTSPPPSRRCGRPGRRPRGRRSRRTANRRARLGSVLRAGDPR